MNELGDFAVPAREFRVTNVLQVTLAGFGAVLLATGRWRTFRYVPGPGGSGPRARRTTFIGSRPVN